MAAAAEVAREVPLEEEEVGDDHEAEELVNIKDLKKAARPVFEFLGGRGADSKKNQQLRTGARLEVRAPCSLQISLVVGAELCIANNAQDAPTRGHPPSCRRCS